MGNERKIQNNISLQRDYTCSDCMFFWLHSFSFNWKGRNYLYRWNQTNRVTVVTQTDYPKSVRNRCVIEVFGDGVLLLFFHFMFVKDFCHRTRSDLFLLSLSILGEWYHCPIPDVLQYCTTALMRKEQLKTFH